MPAPGLAVPDCVLLLHVLFVEPEFTPAEQLETDPLGWRFPFVEHVVPAVELPALQELLLPPPAAPLALQVVGLAFPPLAFAEQYDPVGFPAVVEHVYGPPELLPPETEHDVELVHGLVAVEQVPAAPAAIADTKPVTQSGLSGVV